MAENKNKDSDTVSASDTTGRDSVEETDREQGGEDADTAVTVCNRSSDSLGGYETIGDVHHALAEKYSELSDAVAEMQAGQNISNIVGAGLGVSAGIVANNSFMERTKARGTEVTDKIFKKAQAYGNVSVALDKFMASNDSIAEDAVEGLIDSITSHFIEEADSLSGDKDTRKKVAEWLKKTVEEAAKKEGATAESICDAIVNAAEELENSKLGEKAKKFITEELVDKLKYSKYANEQVAGTGAARYGGDLLQKTQQQIEKHFPEIKDNRHLFTWDGMKRKMQDYLISKHDPKVSSEEIRSQIKNKVIETARGKLGKTSYRVGIVLGTTLVGAIVSNVAYKLMKSDKEQEIKEVKEDIYRLNAISRSHGAPGLEIELPPNSFHERLMQSQGRHIGGSGSN